MHTLEERNSEVETMLYEKTKHPYVEKFIKKPFIDYDKLHAFNILYNELQINQKQKNNEILSVLLVQLALDTHETIKSEYEITMQDTIKQITVLAGDYYSGLYYYLLSEMENISLIKTLAHAIETINEEKMILYKNDTVSFESFVQTIEKIETFLLEKVSEFYQIESETFMILKHFLTIKRLKKEHENYTQDSFSYYGLFQSKINVEEHTLIEDEISKREQLIRNICTKSNTVTNECKKYVMNSLNIYADITVVEEG